MKGSDKLKVVAGIIYLPVASIVDGLGSTIRTTNKRQNENENENEKRILFGKSQPPSYVFILFQRVKIHHLDSTT